MELAIAWFLLFMTILNRTSSARTPGEPSPSHSHSHQPIMTFVMQDVVASSKPVTTKVDTHLPFPKPLGLFPPSGGIPMSELNPTNSHTQTLDMSGIGFSFPAIATLQELEFGTVTVINEELFEVLEFGSPAFGKAEGIYVASSEDGNSHMMAMTTFFAKGGFTDGLRFFGLRHTDASEFHIAIIGGTGKYHGANGYATVKAVSTVASNTNVEINNLGAKKLLLCNVYLSS